jgi:hypothetical protein
MLMKKLICVVAMFGLSIGLAVVAYAQITFNPGNGTGFVGKDEIQQAFGWKNGDVRKNIGRTQFRYVSSTEYSWECERLRGPAQTIAHSSEGGEEDSLLSEVAQKGGQISGINLVGIASSIIFDPFLLPGSCPEDQGHPTTLVEGSLHQTTSSSLEVSLNGGTWLPLQ